MLTCNVYTFQLRFAGGLEPTPAVIGRSHSLLGSLLESPIKEAGVPGENLHVHGENVQTPHRKAPAGIEPGTLFL